MPELIILFIPIVILLIFLRRKEASNYIESIGGEVCSIDRNYNNWKWTDGKNVCYYDVKFFDENNNLHYTLIRFGAFGSVTVLNDVIVERNSSKQINVTAKTKRSKVAEKINVEPIFKEIKYKCYEGEITVLQEYHYPNVGEEVYLNNVVAPNGKYKIGHFHNIIVCKGYIEGIK